MRYDPRLTYRVLRYYCWFLLDPVGKPCLVQADLDAYLKGHGRAALAGDAGYFESIQKGIAPGPIDYSSWDEQTLRDFKLASGFAGLRPEVREAYGAMLDRKSVV